MQTHAGNDARMALSPLTGRLVFPRINPAVKNAKSRCFELRSNALGIGHETEVAMRIEKKGRLHGRCQLRLAQALAIGAHALSAAAADLADNLAGNHLAHDGRHKAGGSQLGTLVDVGRVAGLCLNRFLAAKQYV